MYVLFCCLIVLDRSRPCHQAKLRNIFFSLCFSATWKTDHFEHDNDQSNPSHMPAKSNGCTENSPENQLWRSLC